MNIIRIVFSTFLFVVASTTFAQVSINYSSGNGDPGDQVTIEVRTDNFDDIAAMQFSTNWDASVLSFVSIGNFNSTLGLDASSFGTPDNLSLDDAVTVTWFDVSLQGVTLPANTLLFTITLEIVGSPGQQSDIEMTDTPTAISFQSGTGNNVDAVSQSGTVMVNGMGGSDEIELIASDETGGPGMNVCVQITANGFSQIVSAQWNHTYNTDILDFTGIQNINLDGLNAGLFNVNESTGEVRLSYVAPPPSVSAPDGTVLYELCFNIAGSAGSMSQLDITSLPGNPIEIIQIQDGMDVQVTPQTTDGSVSVSNIGGPDDLVLSFPDTILPESGSVCIPVTFENFNDIQAIQNLAMFWDPAVLDYTGVQNEGICGTIPNDLTIVETDVDQGELSLFYVFVDLSTGEGCTIEEGTLFEICFDIVGECEDTTALTFGTSGGQVLIFNSQSDPLAFSTEEGSASIICTRCEPEVTVTPATCRGSSDGRITLNLDQCDDVTDVNPSQEDLMSLTAGSYDVTITYDNGNETLVLEDIVVGEPDSLVTLVSTDIQPDCDGSGGSIDIEISGLVGDASYEWSTGETTQDISGVRCQDDIRVTITDSENPTCIRVLGPFDIPCPPAINGTAIDVQCAGEENGGVDLEVTLGSGDFEYEWSCEGDVGMDGDLSNVTSGECSVTVTDNVTGCVSEASFTINEPDPLMISDVVITEDTAGLGTGSISINVEGGVGGYSYIWNVGSLPDAPDVTGLVGGMYSVVVIDTNGCSVDMNFQVDVYDFLEVFGEVMEPLCSGEQNGAILITVTGGRAGYTYDWSCPGDVGPDGSLNNVGAGNCTVTVTDAEGVVVEESFTVDEPGPIAAEITVTPLCDIGEVAEAEIDIQGGTAPYLVEWNTNPAQTGTVAINLEPGTLTAIVIDDNGCELAVSEEVESCIDPADCYKASEVITPNLDGVNEVFVINCVDDFPNRLRIFNEQGQDVFTVDNYQNDWNGVDDGGNELIDDTYMWVLEIFLPNGDRRIERGTVTVIRELK